MWQAGIRGSPKQDLTPFFCWSSVQKPIFFPSPPLTPECSNEHCANKLKVHTQPTVKITPKMNELLIFMIIYGSTFFKQVSKYCFSLFKTFTILDHSCCYLRTNETGSTFVCSTPIVILATVLSLIALFLK